MAAQFELGIAESPFLNVKGVLLHLMACRLVDSGNAPYAEGDVVMETEELSETVLFRIAFNTIGGRNV